MKIKPKSIESAIIASPNDYNPTTKNLEIVGTFNPGVTTIDTLNGLETVVLVRVAEAAKQKNPKGVSLPFAEVKNQENSPYHIGFDYVPNHKIKKNNKESIIFKNNEEPNGNTSRLKHLSHFKIMRLNEKGKIIEQSQKPLFFPKYEYERFGIEDTRITKFNDPKLKKIFGGDYLLTYVIPHRDHGVCTCYAITNDFKKFQRIGPKGKIKPVFEGTKDIAIFPEMINNEIYKLTRPNAFDTIARPPIGIKSGITPFSFEDYDSIIRSRTGGIVGPNNAPIKMEKEDIWFGAYHEVRNNGKKNKYITRLYGLDLKNPKKVKYLSESLLERKDYNQLLGKKPGYISPVVYSTGITEEKNTLTFYSGVDDTWLVRDVFDKKELMAFLMK
jgi:predicted GH43/DUF377 family glycosyl hydrolase